MLNVLHHKSLGIIEKNKRNHSRILFMHGRISPDITKRKLRAVDNNRCDYYEHANHCYSNILPIACIMLRYATATSQHAGLFVNM